MKILRLLTPIGLSSSLLCLSMWLATNNLVSIEFEINQPGNNAVRIYVDSGRGFNEKETFSFRSSPDDQWRSIRTTPIMKPAMIRIDTVHQETGFELKDIRLKRLDTLLPFSNLLYVKLDSSKSLSHHHISKAQGSSKYHSTGNDPQLVWRIPDLLVHDRITASGNFILTLGALAAVTIFTAWFFERRSSRVRYTVENVWLASEALLIYPIFLVIAKLTDRFASILDYHLYALGLAVVGYGCLLSLQALKAVTWRTPLYLVTVCIILLSFIPDLLFRANVLGKPIFARYEQPGYYWTLGRSNPYRHTSLGYYGDIERIREIVKPGSLFLSDRATSYYLTASLPLYAANLHAHHQVSYEGWFTNISDEFMRKICRTSYQEYAREYLREKQRRHDKFDWPAIRYFVVNRDLTNRNVRSDCLARHRRLVLDNLGPIIRPVYSGAALDVYEFNISDDPGSVSRLDFRSGDIAVFRRHHNAAS